MRVSIPAPPRLSRPSGPAALAPGSGRRLTAWSIKIRKEGKQFFFEKKKTMSSLPALKKKGSGR
jgi:hypothetical protein